MNELSIMTSVGFTGLLVALLAMVTVNQAFEYNVLFCRNDYECIEKDPWRPFCLASECHEKYQMLMCMSDDDCKKHEICRSHYCRDILFF